MPKELVYIFERTNADIDKASRIFVSSDGQLIETDKIPQDIDNDKKVELSGKLSNGNEKLQGQIYADFINNDFLCLDLFVRIRGNYKWPITMRVDYIESSEFTVLYENKSKRKFVFLKSKPIDLPTSELESFYRLMDKF